MQQIILAQHGILPGEDITLPLRELFLRYPADTEFIFEAGDYYFCPHEEMRVDYRISNSDEAHCRTLAIWMQGMKNCVLRGNGARLWLAGHMQVFTLDRCQRVTVEGFTVDWEKPLVAEGRVVARGDMTLDVYVDPVLFPHRMGDACLEFDVGAGEWYPTIGYAIAFEPHGLTVRRGTADVRYINTEALGGSVYRLTLKRPSPVEVGDLLNLRHNARLHAGCFAEKCEDVTVRDVTFHSCGGLGCLAQFCHNATFERVHFMPNYAMGRKVSCGRDDGMHLTCNSGKLTVTQCSFHALMDDPINVHGCCVTANEVVDDCTLRCHYRHGQAKGFWYWAEPGDTVSMIARETMHSIGCATVESYTLESPDSFLLRLTEPVTDAVRQAAERELLAVDNLTHTADFVCTDNRFGSCRARGLLVSTPGKVEIKRNFFESSGSAILLAGDSNYWFESGECHDVTISQNVFAAACCSSVYQFCDGVISISPVVPKPDEELPYHKHILITDNVFDLRDTPALYAFSCRDLRFVGNRVYRRNATDASMPTVKLTYCRDGIIDGKEVLVADHCRDLRREGSEKSR
jgi:hypothetical protein